jgi:DNA polymerase-1
MKHVVFEERNEYPIAILIKDSYLNKAALEKHYISYLESKGINKNEVIIIGIPYNENDKITVKFAREYLTKISKPMHRLGIKYMYVAEGTYFKALTKVRKLEPYYGYALDNTYIKHPTDWNPTAILGVYSGVLNYNPKAKDKLELGLNTLVDSYQGCYIEPGTGVIHSSEYPDTYFEKEKALDKLHQYPMLAVDIETFGLNPHQCGLGTIGFSWDEHNGIAFSCDYTPREENNRMGGYAWPERNELVRKLLKNFFEKYEGTLIFHGANFDIKVLVAQIWMQDPLDYKNQLIGTEILTRNFHCTKVIAYLATNNCVENKLGLKDLAQEHLGNWAQEDIKDITKIQEDNLLEYNLADCLGAFYVFNKYYPIMVQEDQLDIYKELFRPCLAMIINVEINGMPMSSRTISDNLDKLHHLELNELGKISNSPAIEQFTKELRYAEFLKANIKLKVKQRPIDDFDHISFNPNSVPQLQKLLYEDWKLPVLKKTDKGSPAVGAKQLEGLLAYLNTNQNIIPNQNDKMTVISALVELTRVRKIIGTFFKAFQNGLRDADFRTYLHGTFNITGTKSGRLSSSDPNLQNLPATGTIYAKTVKECFQAPHGWLMMGADFDSLEDKISALTTKDPNKLKVYTDGYDGHSLRAFSYFGDHMSGIDPESVDSINSIAQRYPDFRQDSKGPTFALTYGGTNHALIEQCGLDKEDAMIIEQKYHELYKVSDEWVADKIQEASDRGYVEVAFGLRLRTPLLARTDPNKSYTPYEAYKEAKTAGNALGQSYCLLNNRAALDFMRRVEASPYKHDIKLICLIHDAIYLLVKDHIDVVHWVNENLPDCMAWQDLPDIQHDQVKLSGSAEIYYPTWADVIPLPNHASKQEILDICKKVK